MIISIMIVRYHIVVFGVLQILGVSIFRFRVWLGLEEPLLVDAASSAVGAALSIPIFSGNLHVWSGLIAWTYLLRLIFCAYRCKEFLDDVVDLSTDFF